MKKFLLLIISLTLLFVSCDKKKSSSSKKGFTPRLDPKTSASIVIAGSYKNFESLEEEIIRFSEFYPDIDVSYISLDNYNKNILPALKGEAAPDIFCAFTWMIDKKNYDELFNLSENLSDENLDIDLSGIQQELITRQNGGQVLMLPIFANTHGMLVNEDLFKKYGIKVPKTYEDLKKACKKFKENGISSPVMGYFAPNGLFVSLALPYFCNSITKKPGAVASLNSLINEAGEYLRPLLDFTEDFLEIGAIDENKCLEEITDSYSSIILRFFKGDVPMMFVIGDVVSGTQKRESLSKEFTENPFRYKFSPIPTNAHGGIFLPFHSLGFCVNKNSSNLEVTNEFIRFLSRKDQLNNMAKLKRIVSVSTDFSLDEMFSDFSKVDSIYLDQLGLMDNAIKEMRAAVYLLATGKLSKEVAIKNYGKLDELLK